MCLGAYGYLQYQHTFWAILPGALCGFCIGMLSRDNG
jgi:hypothetical protein